MELQQRTRRFGLYVIVCACLLRLATSGSVGAVLRYFLEKVPLLTYSETGQDVRFSASVDTFFPHVRESPAPWLPEPEKPCFSAEDAEMVELDNNCARQPDLASLLTKPLDWDLTGDAPAVLILHTHTTESYTKAGETYQETARYRTLEEDYNMLSIGDAVTEILEAAGIGVIHDRTVHDYPSYNGAYVHARNTTEEILAEVPSIRLILDLHRDAAETAGRQMRTQALVAGESAAQLMFVVGTDVSWATHEHWEENLSLALKLQVLLERAAPGIVRPLNLRGQRFNQDLCHGALLVEVGAAGNTRPEALKAARALAEAVVQLARGDRSFS